MGELRISIIETNDDVAELHDLYETIADDGDLRAVRKSLEPGEPGVGQMGAEEWIRLILDNPGLYTAVSSCVAAWLASRKPRRLRLVVRGDDGATTEVEIDGIKKVAVEDLLNALDTVRKKPGDAPTQQ